MKLPCFAVLLCLGFAVATDTPPVRTRRDENRNEIGPSASIATNVDASVDNDQGEDLSRTKKSTTTTTFCVEIKPGTDKPEVVVCDASKAGQQIIPLPTETANKPTYDPVIDDRVSNLYSPVLRPVAVPQYQQALPDEPLLFIPQQSQIIQPAAFYPQQHQIPQAFYPQPAPQIIFVRDPNCPWSNTPKVPNTYHQNLQVLNPTARSGRFYPMNNAEIRRSGLYGDTEEETRSFTGILNGYPNPLNAIYPRRGAGGAGALQHNLHQQQNNPAVHGATGTTGANANQNYEGQYDRPVLIQCNPAVIPLSQEAYAAATNTANNANNPVFRSGMTGSDGASLRAVPEPGRFLQQPAVAAGQLPADAGYTSQGTMPYQRLHSSADVSRDENRYEATYAAPPMANVFQLQPRSIEGNIYARTSDEQLRQSMPAAFGVQQRTTEEARRGAQGRPMQEMAQQRPRTGTPDTSAKRIAEQGGNSPDSGTRPGTLYAQGHARTSEDHEQLGFGGQTVIDQHQLQQKWKLQDQSQQLQQLQQRRTESAQNSHDIVGDQEQLSYSTRAIPEGVTSHSRALFDRMKSSVQARGNMAQTHVAPVTPVAPAASNATV